jgi:hypothetical protein
VKLQGDSCSGKSRRFGMWNSRCTSRSLILARNVPTWAGGRCSGSRSGAFFPQWGSAQASRQASPAAARARALATALGAAAGTRAGCVALEGSRRA